MKGSVHLLIMTLFGPTYTAVELNPPSFTGAVGK
jgi:hypothetical protein